MNSILSSIPDSVVILGFLAALIAFITKCLELYLGFQKIKSMKTSTESIVSCLRKEDSKYHDVTQRNLINELEKKIRMQWDKVIIFGAVSFVLFILASSFAVRQDMSMHMATAGSCICVLTAFAYSIIAFIEGRRAVRLHEEKARIIVLEKIWIAIHRKQELNGIINFSDPTKK